MGLALPGVLPDEFAEVVLGRQIHLELDLLDADDAFNRMQPRAEHKGVFGAKAAAALPDGQFAVALAGCEAHANQQAPRTLDAERIQQLLAEFAESPRMHQQHALLVQPDMAGARIEAQERKEFSHVVSLYESRTAPTRHAISSFPLRSPTSRGRRRALATFG